MACAVPITTRKKHSGAVRGSGCARVSVPPARRHRLSSLGPGHGLFRCAKTNSFRKSRVRRFGKPRFASSCDGTSSPFSLRARHALSRSARWLGVLHSCRDESSLYLPPRLTGRGFALSWSLLQEQAPPPLQIAGEESGGKHRSSRQLTRCKVSARQPCRVAFHAI